MKKAILLVASIIISVHLYSVETDSASINSFPLHGTTINTSDFFNDYYHYDDYYYFLDNYHNFITVEQETTGDYSTPERKIFSIAGNSYLWNKMYINGFRIDSRFNAGQTDYDFSMYNHSMAVNYHTSKVQFTTDSVSKNWVTLTGNTGNLGGIMPGTKELIHLFHYASYERVLTPLDKRTYMKGAVNANTTFNIKAHNRNYTQHISFDYGRRMLTAFSYKGIDELFPSDYYKVQLQGMLPIKANPLFDNTYYLIHFLNRDDYNSEFYYGKNEQSTLNSYSASVYGNKQKGDLKYTLGITWATNELKHNNPNFSRNLIDQDCEAMEPWYPDGYTNEYSLIFNAEQKLHKYFKLTFDSYNSLIHFAPNSNNSYNTGYAQFPLDENYTPLYYYKWQSESFVSGLLENTLSLQYSQKPVKWLNINANFDFTVDAMLIGKKSMISPNYQAAINLTFNPCKWFFAEINVGNYRVSYNIEDIKYFSDKYLNGEIYYWTDKNNDRTYQEGEAENLYVTTGGKYHRANGYLKQMQYLLVDIPFYFRFGRHEISFMQSYKRYYNTRLTYFDGDENDYGYYNHSEELGADIFMFYGGQEINYIVDDKYPDGIMGYDAFRSTPYYLSSVIKYEYKGKKVLFSIAWQSYEMCGLGAIGNGPIHNNISTLSESQANQNTYLVHRNMESPVRANGRLDQDRAYVAWMQLTYNICKYYNMTLTGKFRDGQPFAALRTHMVTNSDGETQLQFIPYHSRGINNLDGHFGTREDAFFNFDLRATGYIPIGDKTLELQLTCYNIFDFGTGLTEYNIGPNIPESRYSLSLCIPRGLLFSAKIIF